MSLGMNRTRMLAALVPLFICAGLSVGQNATLLGQEQLAKGIAALRAGDLRAPAPGALPGTLEPGEA